MEGDSLRLEARQRSLSGWSPWVQAIAAGTVFVLVSAACLIATHDLAKGILRATVDEELCNLASIAADLIDADRHHALRHPSQLNNPEYMEVVEPLRRLLNSSGHLKYVYTIRNSPEGPRFVVDAADPVDADGDGVIDQSALNELYTEPDAAMLEALQTGRTTVSQTPSTDQWGTFISAFAPVHRADGSLECVVGVDITAAEYLSRLAAMDRVLIWGAGLIVASGVVLGTLILMIQRRRRVAVQSLIESESLFLQISSAAPVMLWMVDRDRTPIFFSRSWLEFTARTLDEEVGSVWSSIHDEDRPHVELEFKQAFASRRPFEKEFRLRRADGEYRWVLSRGIPRLSGSHRFLGYVGGAIDVTERHEAEVQQSLALGLATSLASASTVSQAARLVNDALHQSLGISRSAVLLFGDDGMCRFVGWRGVSETYRNAVDGHCPWRRHARDANIILVHDASTDPAIERFREVLRHEGIRSLAFIPVMTERGVAGKLVLYSSERGGIDASRVAASTTLAAYLGVAVGRLAAQERLAASESRIRAIIDTALDGVIAMDEWWRITDWNSQAETIFGWSKDEAIGLPISALIGSAESADAGVTLVEHWPTGQELGTVGRRVELPARRRDGSTFTVEMALTPIHLEDKVHYSAFFRDITAKKQVEADLLQAKTDAENANRSKSEFLANMSHEIRTPMTAILGFADLLEADSAFTNSPEKRKEAVSTIKKHGEGLLTIINDILDLSKIEADKMTVERIDFSPVSALEEVRSLMSVRASDKNVFLKVVHQTPIPERITSDPTRLKQILINLVGNAIKFTDSGGVTISMSCEPNAPSGPAVRFEVTDTGIGMTPEQCSRVFRAFEQADSSTTRKFGGTGLGLRICERLAALLGGAIDVRSDPGRGSTFGVTIAVGSLAGVAMLPPDEITARLRTDSSSNKEADASRRQRRLLAGSRILLVEDGVDNQRLIAHHLEKAGAEVTLASNGRLAVETLTRPGSGMKEPVQPAAFDLILMDMQMPEMDGYSAARWLRRIGSVTPIIALTAHAMSGDREKCLAAGCDDYVSKPIDKHKLLDACRALIDRSHERARAA
ncbi:MAG: PAS domain S-box protein [Phycisphaerae bacterium]|nr:PAS domain S-box protein [Phycisphaerae bacterium]